MSELSSIHVSTPLGKLNLTASEEGITNVGFDKIVMSDSPRPNSLLLDAREQMKAYFVGDLRDFDIPLDFSGAPTFHQEVWQALCRIPYGEKVSYKDIAIQLGQPNGSQAVGQANAKNPVAIIVPCHRVVGSNGSLTGYAWGLDIKKWLLRHELNHSPTPAHLLF